MRMLPSKMVPFSVSSQSLFLFLCGRAKNDSKPQRVDADVLEKGAKKISVFRQERIRVDGAKVEQKLTFLHFTFSGGRGAGMTKENPV